jgi:hypothetical protein
MEFNLPNAVLGPAGMVLGCLALVWPVLAYWSQRRFEKTALRATGVVQELTAERGGRKLRTTFYFPVVRFTTAAGDVVSVKSKTGRSGGYRIGQALQVLYDPDDPANAVIDAPWSRWLIVAVALFMAVLFFAVGAGALLSQ